MIIYDDLTGATRAAAALKRAAWRANVSADWDIKPWRTEALKFPSVADKALIEAADADLILTQELCAVCAVGYREVNETVRALEERNMIHLATLELWLEGKIALVRTTEDGQRIWQARGLA